MGFQSHLGTLAEPGFQFGEDAFLVGLPRGDQVIEDPSQLVGCGDNGLGDSQFGSHAPVVFAQIGMAVIKGPRGETQGEGGTVVDLTSSAR